ncbi:unnamed protein product, partial [Vitis vinifera]
MLFNNQKHNKKRKQKQPEIGTHNNSYICKNNFFVFVLSGCHASTWRDLHRLNLFKQGPLFFWDCLNSSVPGYICKNNFFVFVLSGCHASTWRDLYRLNLFKQGPLVFWDCLNSSVPVVCGKIAFIIVSVYILRST